MKKTILLILVLLAAQVTFAHNLENTKDMKESEKNEAAKATKATKAAFIYIAPENNPQVHRAVIDSPVIHLTVVGVVDYNEAEKIALELVSEGIVAIELCAGFGNEGTARIAKCVGDKALVGVVRFDLHPAFGHKSGDSLF